MKHPLESGKPFFGIAFYKGTRPGIIDGLSNRIGRFLDRGPYSHTEMIFSDGLSGSSSFVDKGVRIKKIGYSSTGAWDFLHIPDTAHNLEYVARRWYEAHLGQPYDLWGNVRFATNFARDSPDKWFCSESNMAALRFPDAYRYGPSGTAALLTKVFKTKLIVVK